MTLGRRLRALRKQAKLSQHEIAQRLRMTRAGYGKYELDKVSPSLARLEALATIFHVTLTALVPPRRAPEHCPHCAQELPPSS